MGQPRGRTQHADRDVAHAARFSARPLGARASRDVSGRFRARVESSGKRNHESRPGAGAIRSSTSDMVKFIKANISSNDSSLNKAMKLSHEIAFSDENKNFKIGLGWHFANNNTITWHNGGTGGYRAFTGFLNNSNRGVVVLTNSVSSVDAIGLKLLDAPLNLELPTVKEFPDVVEVSNEVLESYVGVYQITPEFAITISRKDNQIFLQATGQPEFEIFPSAENEFFLKVVEASVTFNKNENDEISSLTLHQGGQDIPGIKVK